MDAERNPALVINALVHEIGHMRQDILNPEQTRFGNVYTVKAMQEAGAQQFQRAFWLALEEFLGLQLMEYPNYPLFHELIDERLNTWLVGAGRNEHWLGSLMQWLMALGSPDLQDLREELTTRGALSASASLRLYDHIARMSPDAIQEFVTQGYLAAPRRALRSLAGAISRIAKNRLKSGLHPDNEGRPTLRFPGLLSP